MADLLPLDERARPDIFPELTIEPGQDIRDHAALGNHRVIGVLFPKFRDGRGYSTARILRESGFTGDIRAIGDLTIDQVVALHRTGFSSILPDKPITPEAAREALQRFPYVYQRAADSAPPAWELRHGKAES